MDTAGATRTQTTGPVTGTARTLLVRLGDRVVGLETRATRGVVALDGLTAVPRATLPLLGLVGVRGSIVPVVELAMLFDTGRQNPTSDTAVLIESGGETYAFPVDEVVGFSSTEVPSTPGVLLTNVQEFGGRTFDALDITMATAALTARISLT